MPDGRYVLVYHEDLIANYGSVWDDDRALATWLRLLALADKLWPSPSEMPRGVKPSVVKQLVAAGLIEALPNHRYKVRGLDALRQRRTAVARNAAESRWSNADSTAASNASSNAQVMPHADAGARARSGHGSSIETTGEEGVQGETGADALDAFYRLTGSWPSAKVLPWLTQLTDAHGDAAVSEALGAECKVDSTRNTLLGRVRDRLEREAHEAEKRRQAATKKAEEDERKRIDAMPPEQRAANLKRLRKMMAEQGLHLGKPLPTRGDA